MTPIEKLRAFATDLGFDNDELERLAGDALEHESLTVESHVPVGVRERITDDEWEAALTECDEETRAKFASGERKRPHAFRAPPVPQRKTIALHHAVVLDEMQRSGMFGDDGKVCLHSACTRAETMSVTEKAQLRNESKRMVDAKGCP